MPPITEIQWSPDESTFAQQGGDNTLLVSVSESGGVLFDLQNGALVGFPVFPGSTIQLRAITGELIRERVLPFTVVEAVVSGNRVLTRSSGTGTFTFLNYNLETVGNLVAPPVSSLDLFCAFNDGFAYGIPEEVIDIYTVGTLYGVDLNGFPLWDVHPQKGIIFGAVTSCGDGIFVGRLNNSVPVPPVTAAIRVNGSDGSMSDTVFATSIFGRSNPANASAWIAGASPQDLVIVADGGAGQFPSTAFTTPYKTSVAGDRSLIYAGFSSAFMYSSGPNSNVLDAPLGVYDALNNNQLAWNGPTGWICVGAMLFN